ncbi:MAG: sigma-54-dependent Fis family transcriptional regulator [Candidatus Latescibacteria bacterium]|nr:sigma-54-dependent Fis family transcriptional regulator [Candidatus Latescibacterota bacterium]
MKRRILIVDDKRNQCEALRDSFEDDGYEVFIATRGSDALLLIDHEEIDLVITDLMMPEMDGNALLKVVKERQSDIAVILITGQGSIETAVAAMRLGAYDYIEKPVRLLQIRKLVEKALENRVLRLENETLKTMLELRCEGHVIGRSRVWMTTVERAVAAARTRSTVLLTGESGTGKEIIAEVIHDFSPRKERPLIKVNCAALPESLLESELFGYEKGAFTGAVKTKPGRFELADGGTLFLDEITEIDHNVQVKLLRVLQQREFERVGGTKTLKADVRIVAATNKDIALAVREGTFRDDLYYRLNVISIDVPPLRKRKEDIPLFVEYFIQKHCRANSMPLKRVTLGVMNVLGAYQWPGNVRELENAVECAVVMTSSDTITPHDLPRTLWRDDEEEEDDRSPQYDLHAFFSLRAVEERTIRLALEETGGDKRKTAKLLGIGLATLYRKCQIYRVSQNGNA